LYRSHNSEHIFPYNFFDSPLLKKNTFIMGTRVLHGNLNTETHEVCVILKEEKMYIWKLCDFYTYCVDFTQIVWILQQTLVNLMVTRDLCKKIDIESHGNFLSAVNIVFGLAASPCICYSNWTSNKMFLSTLLVLFRNLKISKKIWVVNQCLATRDPFDKGLNEKNKQKNLMPKRNETLFFKKQNETERYFFWKRNQNDINIFQKRNEKK
jgi:hypothetical protein